MVNHQITDDKGNRHYINEKIGTDGQGDLYSTKNSDVLVRIASDNINQDLYNNVELLPVSDIKNLLMPDAYLKEPNRGHTICIPPGYVTLDTLKAGGLKRRLNILINLSRTLTKLHALPVMYGSMSPSRILISSKPTVGEAYLLYSAKMDFFTRFTKDNDSDPYIAPEVKNGQGGTLASDSYTFGALAYDFLSQVGEIPEMLKALLDRCRLSPTERPKINELYRAFLAQLDLLLSCKKCQTDFNYESTECPNCQVPAPKMLRATIYDEIDEETKIERGVKVLEFTANRQSFRNYHTDIVLLDDEFESRIDCLLNISADRKLHLVLKNLMDKEMIVNEKLVPGGTGVILALPCELIHISFPLYLATTRCIDMVMV